MSSEVKITYRQCFSTDSGKKVLTDILIQCGYFDTDLHPDNIYNLNIAHYILHSLGVFDKINLRQQQRFVDKLFDIPVDYTGEREVK